MRAATPVLDPIVVGCDWVVNLTVDPGVGTEEDVVAALTGATVSAKIIAGNAPVATLSAIVASAATRTIQIVASAAVTALLAPQTGFLDVRITTAAALIYPISLGHGRDVTITAFSG